MSTLALLIAATVMAEGYLDTKGSAEPQPWWCSKLITEHS